MHEGASPNLAKLNGVQRIQIWKQLDDKSGRITTNGHKLRAASSPATVVT